MEAIVRKWNTWSLIWISDNEWELELAQKKYDEVITDFTVTDEQKFLINNWASFTYNNWIILWDTTEVENNCKKQEISAKVSRMEEINKELLQLWDSNALVSYPALDTIRNNKITSLTAEFESIKADLDSNYESTLIDDVLNSLFS